MRMISVGDCYYVFISEALSAFLALHTLDFPVRYGANKRCMTSFKRQSYQTAGTTSDGSWHFVEGKWASCGL